MERLRYAAKGHIPLVADSSCKDKNIVFLALGEKAPAELIGKRKDRIYPVPE